MIDKVEMRLYARFRVAVDDSLAYRVNTYGIYHK